MSSADVPPGFAGALRVVRADNAGPFTLDGTRSYLIGRSEVAVVDPGPDLASHREALLDALRGVTGVTLLLTHGHADHAAATDALAEELDREGRLHRVAGAGHPRAEPLADGAYLDTDAGRLRALHTPGHSEGHLSFHWPERRALFPGDLLLGRGDTTWVGGYSGCVADYLASLDRLRGLELEVLLPTHGPPLTEPARAFDRFEEHRRARIRQVREALETRPDADADEVLEVVYGGEIPAGLEEAALASVKALIEYVRSA